MTMRLRALLLLWVCLCAHAQAAPVRLDDAGSFALQPTVQMQWRANTGKDGRMVDSEVRTTVRIHINTRDYVGRQGRIYMVLPLDSGPQIIASWETQGRLLAGQMASGSRALVFSGLVTSASLDDQLNIRFRSHSVWAASSRMLNFYFEWEAQ